MSNKDSMKNTIIVALLLCVVCSIVVAGSAVILKDMQQANQALDKKVNIVNVAGVMESGAVVEDVFKQFKVRIIDLATGEYVSDEKFAELGGLKYNDVKASKEPALSTKLDKKADIANIGSTPKYVTVYEYYQGNKLDRVVVPVWGYGLWGTLYGFMAIEGNGADVIGLSFYSHKETPGLGGEVDNPKWRMQWSGKSIYNEAGSVALTLVKGGATPGSESGVDALSGATLTSRGVENLLHFWLGEGALGPFLAKIQKTAGGEG